MIKSVSEALPSTKSLIVAGLLVGAGIAQAYAQSNVVVYGRVVEGVLYQSNQNTGRVDVDGNAVSNSGWTMDGNVWGTSMLGFRGTEDLGGGVKALFNLETGFNGSTGAASGTGLWTRRSIVGLNSNLGTLKLGRNQSLPGDVVLNLDSSYQQGLGTATLVKGRNWQSNNNQIDYITPNLGGFTAQGVYGLAEREGATQKGNTAGISLAYVQANYELRAIYDVAKDANGQYSSLFQYSRELTLGGTVTFDKLKLLAGYQNLEAPAVISGPDKASQFWLGANYQVAPALMLLGGAYHVKLNHNGGSANLFMLGANYSMSNRTLLYAGAGTVRNGPQTDFSVTTGDGIAGKNQYAFYSGISHSF